MASKLGEGHKHGHDYSHVHEWTVTHSCSHSGQIVCNVATS